MSQRRIIQLRRAEFKGVQTSLRIPSAPVTEIDEGVRLIAQDLVDTLHAHKISVGLAAPQIGALIRACVVNLSKDKSGPDLVLINPCITRFGAEKDLKYESCLSLPHYKGKVERSMSLDVRFQDLSGQEQVTSISGFMARVVQHEVDHLDGVLFVDRMRDLSELEQTDIFRYDPEFAE